jgi:hypothetical protein
MGLPFRIQISANSREALDVPSNRTRKLRIKRGRSKRPRVGREVGRDIAKLQ